MKQISTETRRELGQTHGKIAGAAIGKNIDIFEKKLEELNTDFDTLYANLDGEWFSKLKNGELLGIAETTGISLRKLVTLNAYRDAVFPQRCTAAIAIGDSTATDGPLFFKHSDAGLNELFEGDSYYKNQEINVIQIEDHPDTYHSVVIAGAGVTGMKMGVNEHGLAIGSTFSRTTTYTADDQKSDNIEVSQGGQRSKYMRDALLACATVHEAASYLHSRLITDPMDTPGNILIADPTKALVLEGDYEHTATRSCNDGIITRANTFEILDQLAIPRSEYVSTYCRHERINNILMDSYGDIDLQTLQQISVDHESEPGGNSICVHPDNSGVSNVDHTDDENSATCSAVIWHLDPDNPGDSQLYIALGTPCSAWRNPKNQSWVRLSPTDDVDDIPDRFLNGEAWIENYQPEEPINSSESIPPLK